MKKFSMNALEEYAHLFIPLTYIYISDLEVEMVSNCLMSFCLRFKKKVCAIIKVIT